MLSQSTWMLLLTEVMGVVHILVRGLLIETDQTRDHSQYALMTRKQSEEKLSSILLETKLYLLGTKFGQCEDTLTSPLAQRDMGIAAWLLTHLAGTFWDRLSSHPTFKMTSHPLHTTQPNSTQILLWCLVTKQVQNTVWKVRKRTLVIGK